MKKFGKTVLIILGVIIGIPLCIVLLLALTGFGALIFAAPGVMAVIIGVLLLISIPGLIVGLIAGHKKD